MSVTFPGSILLDQGFALVSAGWTGVRGFLLYWCNYCHCRSGRDSSVNKSLALLYQLLEGRLSVSKISRVLARCKSQMFVFLDFPFIVLSSTALHKEFYNVKTRLQLWVWSWHRMPLNKDTTLALIWRTGQCQRSFSLLCLIPNSDATFWQSSFWIVSYCPLLGYGIHQRWQKCVELSLDNCLNSFVRDGDWREICTSSWVVCLQLGWTGPMRYNVMESKAFLGSSMWM